MGIRNKGIAVALLVFVGCAYEIKQEKPFEVKTIEVHHTFDFSAVEEYYYSKCFDELKCEVGSSSCSDKAHECSKIKTAEFLDTLAEITKASANGS